jgi:hypothetical protein
MNVFLQTRLCDFWYEMQKKIKEICKRKRSSRLRRHGRVEEFQTFARLRGYLRC